MSMYSHDVTYKNLVLAGAGIVTDLKKIQAASATNRYRIFKDEYIRLYDALKLLVNVAADMTTDKPFYYDMAQIYYADTVSVYAYNKEIGEKYFDLLWRWNAGEEEARAELDALSKTIPDDEHYWIRRNV